MTGFIQTHSSEWLKFLAERGYPSARPLAAGVEGAIYKLEDGLVAKVWKQRRVPELVRMRNFYADVAQADLPFATPVILGVEEVDGVAVTFDRELHGTPVQGRLAVDDATVPDDVAAVLVDCLRALATVAATDHMRALPVLDETASFWAGAETFTQALVAVVERKVAVHGPLLRRHVTDFDRKYEATLARVAVLKNVPDTVVHGDLFAENILADNAGRPVSVLDFGFLSTAGDPRMDAAITAVIVNMYGPHSRAIARQLTELFCGELGYGPEVLLLYRAAYALATSNFLTADGSDGHFEWCVGWLNDPLVSEVLGV